MYVFVRVSAFHRGVTVVSSSNHSVYTDVFVRSVKAQHCKRIVSTNAPRFFKRPPHQLLVSIVVSIPACHAGDRGSIPRRGESTALFLGWTMLLSPQSGTYSWKKSFMIQFPAFEVNSAFQGIGCSVVEFSPATREARVRFPANAGSFEHVISTSMQTPEEEICVRLPGKQKSLVLVEFSTDSWKIRLWTFTHSQ